MNLAIPSELSLCRILASMILSLHILSYPLIQEGKVESSKTKQSKKKYGYPDGVDRYRPGNSRVFTITGMGTDRYYSDRGHRTDRTDMVAADREKYLKMVVAKVIWMIRLRSNH